MIFDYNIVTLTIKTAKYFKWIIAAVANVIAELWLACVQLMRRSNEAVHWLTHASNGHQGNKQMMMADSEGKLKQLGTALSCGLFFQ